jgi:hypothetical protein
MRTWPNQRLGGLSWRKVVLAYLEALTPPLVVCVAFLVGLGLLLRRQLAPKRHESTASRSAPEGDAANADDAEATRMCEESGTRDKQAEAGLPANRGNPWLQEGGNPGNRAR